MRGACKELVAIKTGKGILNTYRAIPLYIQYMLPNSFHPSQYEKYIMLFDAFIMNSTKVQNPWRKSQVALLAEPKTPRVYIIL